MSENVSLSEAARRIVDDLRVNRDSAVDFATLYSKFRTEIDLVIDELANFELTNEHLTMYKDVKILYINSKKNLGDHCVAFGPHFVVLSTYLQNFLDRSDGTNQQYLDAAIARLKKPMNRSDPTSEPLVVAVASSSMNIAKDLVLLLNQLSLLCTALEKDPEYKKAQYRNVLLGVTGAVALVAGILLFFTPFFSAAPVIVEKAGMMMMAGGAAAAAGGVACYHGFGKSLMDSKIKGAVEEYLRQKQKEMDRLKQPVLEHRNQAGAMQLLLEDFIATEFSGGVTEETLAVYIQSFEVLQSAFQGTPPKPNIVEQVKRYIQNKKPIICAVTGATLVTAAAGLVSAAASATSCCTDPQLLALQTMDTSC